MYETIVRHKFQPGDHVTLKTMMEVKESEGRPQLLAVAFVRCEWGPDDKPTVRYYCRALYHAQNPLWTNTISQRFFGGDYLANGWLLLDEFELVAWAPEEKPDDPTRQGT